jgi:hypothetical protein
VVGGVGDDLVVVGPRAVAAVGPSRPTVSSSSPGPQPVPQAAGSWTIVSGVVQAAGSSSSTSVASVPDAMGGSSRPRSPSPSSAQAHGASTSSLSSPFHRSLWTVVVGGQAPSSGAS